MPNGHAGIILCVPSVIAMTVGKPKGSVLKRYLPELWTHLGGRDRLQTLQLGLVTHWALERKAVAVGEQCLDGLPDLHR